MNMDPVHHTHEVVAPDYEREVIVTDDATAVSSMTLTMIGIIVAVALIAVVVAIGPWSTNSNRTNTLTPGQGGADVTPAPSQRLPNQQVLPSQPQIVPTTIVSPR